MTNNQTNNPNEDPNQLSDDELDAVSGGGIFHEVIDATTDLVTDVFEEGKEFIFKLGDTIDKHG